MYKSYLEFWGIDNPVFANAPSVDSFFRPASLANDLDRLVQGTHTALTVVAGGSGTGKTSICHWLAGALPFANYEVLTLTLLKDETEPGWLMPQLSEFMGLTPEGSLKDLAGKFDLLKQEQRKLVIIIDNASYLKNSDAFTDVQALLNMQDLAGEIFGIVLCGDKSLVETIGAIPQLSQRIQQKLVLKPWDEEDSLGYCRDRLGALADHWDSAALSALHSFAAGLPRTLGILAESCLMEAALKETKLIDTELVKRCAKQLSQGMTELPPLPQTSDFVEKALNQPISLKELAKPAISSPKSAPTKKSKPQSKEVGPQKAAKKDKPEIAMNQLFHNKSEPGSKDQSES